MSSMTEVFYARTGHRVQHDGGRPHEQVVERDADAHHYVESVQQGSVPPTTHLKKTGLIEIYCL